MVIYLLISLTDGIWRIPMILTTPIGCLVNGLLIVSPRKWGSSYRDSQAWNMKASYLRLKSFEVGYILPRTFTKKYGVENLRLYFNAYNLFTFTDSFLKQLTLKRRRVTMVPDTTIL